MAGRRGPSSSARLAALESLPLGESERAAVLAQFAQLEPALEALEAFVSETDEPATGFDPLLGGDA